jgi:uncharacterized protein involved in exopolysaccharide biosynthesis
MPPHRQEVPGLPKRAGLSKTTKGQGMLTDRLNALRDELELAEAAREESIDAGDMQGAEEYHEEIERLELKLEKLN